LVGHQMVNEFIKPLMALSIRRIKWLHMMVKY
jgi:hypothetical protein